MTLSCQPTFSLFFGKLLRFYERTIDRGADLSKNNAAAFEIFAYIQEHYTDVTLQKVAERYHYTPEYTYRFIKEVTGRTFTDILIDAKMKHAVSLLKSTSLPISEVAFQVAMKTQKTSSAPSKEDTIRPRPSIADSSPKNTIFKNSYRSCLKF